MKSLAAKIMCEQQLRALMLCTFSSNSQVFMCENSLSEERKGTSGAVCSVEYDNSFFCVLWVFVTLQTFYIQ